MNAEQIRSIIVTINSCDQTNSLIAFFAQLKKKSKGLEKENASRILLKEVIKRVIQNERRLDEQSQTKENKSITERETSNPKARILAELNNINQKSPIPSDEEIVTSLFNAAMNRRSNVAEAAGGAATDAAPAAADDGDGASGGGAAAAAPAVAAAAAPADGASGGGVSPDLLNPKFKTYLNMIKFEQPVGMVGQKIDMARSQEPELMTDVQRNAIINLTKEKATEIIKAINAAGSTATAAAADDGASGGGVAAPAVAAAATATAVAAPATAAPADGASGGGVSPDLLNPKFKTYLNMIKFGQPVGMVGQKIDMARSQEPELMTDVQRNAIINLTKEKATEIIKAINAAGSTATAAAADDGASGGGVAAPAVAAAATAAPADGASGGGVSPDLLNPKFKTYLNMIKMSWNSELVKSEISKGMKKNPELMTNEQKEAITALTTDEASDIINAIKAADAAAPNSGAADGGAAPLSMMAELQQRLAGKKASQKPKTHGATGGGGGAVLLADTAGLAMKYQEVDKVTKIMGDLNISPDQILETLKDDLGNLCQISNIDEDLIEKFFYDSMNGDVCEYPISKENAISLISKLLPEVEGESVEERAAEVERVITDLWDSQESQQPTRITDAKDAAEAAAKKQSAAAAKAKAAKEEKRKTSQLKNGLISSIRKRELTETEIKSLMNHDKMAARLKKFEESQVSTPRTKDSSPPNSSRPNSSRSKRDVTPTDPTMTSWQKETAARKAKRRAAAARAAEGGGGGAAEGGAEGIGQVPAAAAQVSAAAGDSAVRSTATNQIAAVKAHYADELASEAQKLVKTTAEVTAKLKAAETATAAAEGRAAAAEKRARAAEKRAAAAEAKQPAHEAEIAAVRADAATAIAAARKEVTAAEAARAAEEAIAAAKTELRPELAKEARELNELAKRAVKSKGAAEEAAAAAEGRAAAAERRAAAATTDAAAAQEATAALRAQLDAAERRAAAAEAATAAAARDAAAAAQSEVAAARKGITAHQAQLAAAGGAADAQVPFAAAQVGAAVPAGPDALREGEAALQDFCAVSHTQGLVVHDRSSFLRKGYNHQDAQDRRNLKINELINKHQDALRGEGGEDLALQIISRSGLFKSGINSKWRRKSTRRANTLLRAVNGILPEGDGGQSGDEGLER
jgi:colicin import membrane protein